MTAEPEYPIVSTADLKIGQTFRYGPQHAWTAARHRHTTEYAVWVEAKPAPLQAGDRVRYRDDYMGDHAYELTATVKCAGEHWVIVLVDDPNHQYEDVWLLRLTERIEDNQ